MKLKPIGNNIFVLPDKSDEKIGSIILTDFSKKRPTTGTIIAVGNKVEERKVGERVVYGEFTGQRITINWKN